MKLSEMYFPHFAENILFGTRIFVTDLDITDTFDDRA